MKNVIYTTVLLLTSLLFVACKKDKIEYKSDFQKSYNAWIDFKKATGNSYRYQVTTVSWTGLSTATTITVQSGKIMHRSYVAKGPDRNQPSAIVIYEQWEEEEAAINTNTGGFKAVTLDEIYQQAQQEWLVKRSDADVYFEAKNNGMLSNCGYVLKGCADDCFRGIIITSIEKI
ncbi:hypothetical protein SAMN05444266_104309 [Chitinophaga jiangningensis]|uniref:Lipoprotein n=1 Tax=Chitinophaga jiangningensis TaxID=1419482 RepID=A0A1M7CFQ6_9BACT|nr:hypothetical protein [Chitinophaga jiangningensis]SHL66035.1 hypothetical protein SAMN05444266_104309 [Chitinophaga jiangningensis]